MNVPAKRPTNIEEVDIDLLCNLLSQGVTIESACAQVGISRKTYNRWRTAGQELEEQQVFQDFYFLTERARLLAVNRLLDTVYSSAMTEPKSAMWLLERIMPEQFSLKPEFRSRDIEDLREEEQVREIVLQWSDGTPLRDWSTKEEE